MKKLLFVCLSFNLINAEEPKRETSLSMFLRSAGILSTNAIRGALFYGAYLGAKNVCEKIGEELTEENLRNIPNKDLVIGGVIISLGFLATLQSMIVEYKLKSVGNKEDKKILSTISLFANSLSSLGLLGLLYKDANILQPTTTVERIINRTDKLLNGKTLKECCN